MSDKTFLSHSVVFIKKSKKSERKYKNQYINSPDDRKFQAINNEQTPEYLSAISQFMERRSSQKICVDEDNEQTINTPPSKVTFAENETDSQEDNDNKNSRKDFSEDCESFTSVSKKYSADETEESVYNTSSNLKLSRKTNDSRADNKNTSSSVNYEKFQSGKINDSLRKHGPAPSTSFEVSSDTNIQDKQNARTKQLKHHRANNLDSSNKKIYQTTEGTLEQKKSPRSKLDTTDSNTSVYHLKENPMLSSKSTSSSNLSKMKHNFNERLISERKGNPTPTEVSNSIINEISETLVNSEHKIKRSLSKEDNERINGFIKYTVEQSLNGSIGSKGSEDHVHFEFASYVPFINFKELKWHKSSYTADFGWYCEWRKPSWNSTSVLIRRIKSSTMRNSNILISEINALSSIRHPNILVLMGFTFDTGGSVMPIYQYFRHSLHCHIHEMACALSLPKIIKLVLQITEALSFAHMMGLIHTTISSNCIALSDDFNNAKIFGFDFCVPTNSGNVSENIGRKQWYQWLAPEFFDSHSPKAHASMDVYSVCVILWECCYLSIPWKNISYNQLSQIFTKWRMGIPLTNNCYLPTEIYNILKSGFQIDPNMRNISLKEIMKTLKQMQKQFQGDENIFLFTSIDQLSSEIGLQKVIIKKYVNPENNQQLSSTTPSPKSISTNQSPPDRLKVDTEIDEGINTLESIDANVSNQAVGKELNTFPVIPKTSQNIIMPGLEVTTKNAFPVTPKTSHNIVMPNYKVTSNLNRKIEECDIAAPTSLTNYDIKKLIYEYEILTKSIQDSNVPSVNLDRTKLYIRNTDIKPASHRSEFIQVPVLPGSPEHLNDTKKKNASVIKLTVQQQKRLCIEELKNFFEQYLWKKEKNKCLPITGALPLQKFRKPVPKTVENEKVKHTAKIDTNELQQKFRECRMMKLHKSREDDDDKFQFIKSILVEIIDVVCSKNLRLHQDVQFLNNKDIQNITPYKTDYFIEKVDYDFKKPMSLKQCKKEQQKICYQIKRILDVLNFYINLMNMPPTLPQAQIISEGTVRSEQFVNEKTTIVTLDSAKNGVESLNAYQFILFKVPEFMNYWRGLLNLYATAQLRDVYIDDDYTSDAVQLASDLPEFYFLDEDLYNVWKS